MDPSNIMENLAKASKMAQDTGDYLKKIASATDDVDIVAVIIDLAGSAYNLSLDIQESIDTYKEIIEDEDYTDVEESTDDTSDDEELQVNI